MSSDQEAVEASEFNRQEQIWGGLYGPATATEMLARAREAWDETKSAASGVEELRAVFKSVEPAPDEDIDEAGTMRPF